MITDWIQDPCAPHCYMRCANSESTDVPNRVAYIEITPRVRVKPFTNIVDDWMNWEYGPKGCGGECGEYGPSREWCDIKLMELGLLDELIKFNFGPSYEEYAAKAYGGLYD